MPLSTTTILVFILSLAVSYVVIKKVRDVVLYKQLLDNPNARSSHDSPVPNLAGVAFFIVTMLAFYFIHPWDDKNSTIAFIPGLTILFIMGLKDDLVVLSPITKLLAQVFAAVLLVYQYKYSIESLHGFMGIENLSAYWGAIFAVLIIVAVINALNLIDGIDGLAATVGIITFTVFGLLFYWVNNYFLFLLCVVMIGCLLAFLRFNLFEDKKMFMGDTGSMLIGFLLGALSVRFLALEPSALNRLPFNAENLPYVVVTILIIPLFDTARVFVIRLLNKKSPFSPDRSHIHHLIIDYFGVSHRRASFFMGVVHFLIIVLFSILAVRTNQWYLLFFFSLLLILASLFFYKISRYIKKGKSRKNRS